jgi:hypothetical protein
MTTDVRTARLHATLEMLDLRLLALLERPEALDDETLKKVHLLEAARNATLRLMHDPGRDC